MIQLKRAMSICLLTGVLLPTTTIQAVTYYVSPTGNDTSTCIQAKLVSTPKKTIPAGIRCLTGGDTLIIKAGTYADQEITNPPAGSPNSYTVIMGDPSGARPVIAPSGAAYQRGFYCDNGAACHHIELRYVEISTAFNSVKLFGGPDLGYPHHVNFINNIMHDTVHTNILISTSDTGFLGGDHLFQGNEFYNTGIGTPGYPPGFNTIYNPGNRTILEKNTFHNLAHGVGIWHSKKSIQDVIVRSNVFYNIGRSNTDTWQQGNGGFSAIHVSVPGGGHQIYNNIIYSSGDESTFNGIRINPIWGAADTASIQIYNNTIYDIKHPSAAAIRVSAITGGPHFIKNNIAYLAGAGIIGGTQSNNLTTDPSFMDPAGANFRLQSRSEAIDKGVITVTVDFAGIRRPQGTGYDIGAYEAGQGSGPLPPRSLSAQ